MFAIIITINGETVAILKRHLELIIMDKRTHFLVFFISITTEIRRELKILS